MWNEHDLVHCDVAFKVAKNAPCLVCGENETVEEWESPIRICDKCKAAIMKMREDA